MEEEARYLLDDAIALLEADGGDARLAQMLAQSVPTGLTEDTLSVVAPSRFGANYMEQRREAVEAYLAQIAFAPMRLDIQQPAGRAPLAVAAGAAATQVASTSAPMAGAPTPVCAAPSAQAGAMQPTATPQVAFPAAPVQAGGQPPLAPTLDPGAVKVKSTITPAELARIMGRAQASEQQVTSPAATAGASAAIPAAPAQPAEVGVEEAGAAVPIGSKFTFATFVYGDENKHAYHSAQRFAAFADEPGQCNSLFIYGSSGLGKTHLLLAIKNYLAETKPNIKVKYANSQAYIDDFINEISRQKTESRAILREYHEANVLIIDDIQNIIGKQASIEYFFSLMDEFIRENKKVVIASDRAPKKLGMDERLTSRFNAGMLCLVSEPGFEMKYTILKRYYEAIVQSREDASPATVDATLLGAFAEHAGKLTDEQLRHMAEISGNNIRELESFCERCASVSAEREAAGAELTAEDIEGVADEYFDTAHKVIHIAAVQGAVEEFYHVSHEDLIGPKRSRDIAFARHVAVYLSNTLCDLSSKAIGDQFGGRDHSTVINSLKVVEKKIKEDRRIAEDLQQLKNRITLRS